MNSLHCRWSLTALFLVFVASAQAERIPITLSMTAVSKLEPFTNIPITAVAPNTLTLRTIKRSQSNFDELTLTNLVPDGLDRMFNYMHGDPPSYAWTINATNAASFGVNWLEFQNHLSESMPSDVSTLIRFFHPSPISDSNPAASAVDRISNVLRQAGLPNAFMAKDFVLHEVSISIDYYFWHPVLEPLRGVQIRAEIRGEARVVPEPAAGVLFLVGVIVLGLVAKQWCSEKTRNKPYRCQALT